MAERRQTIAVLAAVLVAGIAVPLLVTRAGTALDVPRNDAFAYSRIAQHLHETGSFQLIGYGRMQLVGHLLWAQPFLSGFGDRELAGNIAGLIASGIAIIAYFLLALRFTTLRVAATVTALFLLFQGVALTIPTFMTEPTALALDALALLAAVLALERHGRSAALLVVLAVTATVASFAVREFAVALLLAIAAVTGSTRRDLRVVALSSGVAGILACSVIYTWHARLPGLEPSELSIHARGIEQTARGFVTLGLGLLPVTLVTSTRLLSARRPGLLVLAGAGVGVVASLLGLVRPTLPPTLGSSGALADDVYQRWGASGQTLAVGARPDLLPPWAWLLLNGLAVVGSIALGVTAAAYISARLGRGEGARAQAEPRVVFLEAVALAYLLLIAAFGTLGPLFNDRYLWPVVPVLAILATRVSVPATSEPRRWFDISARAAAVLRSGALVALALIAVTYVQDSAAYDGARWRAGMQLVAHGASPEEVDAGLEWVGAHSDRVRDVDGHGGRPVSSEDPYWEGFWPPAMRCFVVSNERLDPARYSVVGTLEYRSRLWTTPRTLWQLQRKTRQCRKLRPGP